MRAARSNKRVRMTTTRMMILPCPPRPRPRRRSDDYYHQINLDVPPFESPVHHSEIHELEDDNAWDRKDNDDDDDDAGCYYCCC